ncbi:uncharacterized protein MEPE_05347 [Melanopsichium pennsylvanicum]|uniref:WW domain-containing protein n=2 Tax=Melanopsichium pennsylvanicum TaxID=63383 RepID=A0AAJ5C7J6_9BASI|nr:-domain-containing protein [Melanopsichium pennsylvanicum 4]SNX86638.1 uncharacterized protein MEPE_05347 [Melanopsichium pennsylvanicum]
MDSNKAFDHDILPSASSYDNPLQASFDYQRPIPSPISVSHGHRGHAPTPSNSSSTIASFHTVVSATTSPSNLDIQWCRTLQNLESEREIAFRSDPQEDARECRTPTPADGACFSPVTNHISHENSYHCGPRSSLSACVRANSLENFSSAHSTQDEVLISSHDRSTEQGLARMKPRREGGLPVKSLPNGLQALPSPSEASRSFDLSPSTYSRPLTLVSVATSEDGGRTLLPVLHTRAGQRKEAEPFVAEAGKESSNTSDSSFSTSRPSSPNFGTQVGMRSATPTTSRSSAEHNSSRLAESVNPVDANTASPRPSTAPTRAFAQADRDLSHNVSSEWGANFWTVVKDPTNPEVSFFANPSTGECRWLLPKGTIVLPPSGDGEWWELIDEQTGREYYWHTVTRECRWERPQTQQAGRGVMVIPMRAVQMSRHAKEVEDQTRVGRRDASDGDELLRRNGTLDEPFVSPKRHTEENSQGDRGAIVTTPLRPRTKSLAKIQHRCESALRTGQSHTNRDEFQVSISRNIARTTRSTIGTTHCDQLDHASKARFLIVERDQRALSMVRKTSPPLFHPDILPTSGSTALSRRRQRRSITGTANVSHPQRPSSPPLPPPALPRSGVVASGISASRTFPPSKARQFLGLASEFTPSSRQYDHEDRQGRMSPPIISIRKLGKGLAFDVTDPLANSSTTETITTATFNNKRSETKSEQRRRLMSKKSLPSFPSTSSSSKHRHHRQHYQKGEERRKIVGLPIDLTQALVETSLRPLPLASASASASSSALSPSITATAVRMGTVDPSDETHEASTTVGNKLNNKGRKLGTKFIVFARCRTNTVNSTSSTTISEGNFSSPLPHPPHPSRV